MGRRKTGRLSVATTADEHFKVEVLDEAEQKTIATFTAPTQEAQVIPPGSSTCGFPEQVNVARPRNWMQALAAITV